MLDVVRSQVDVETEFGVLSLILLFFINFSFDKMIFSIMQVSRDRERHCLETMRVEQLHV